MRFIQAKNYQRAGRKTIRLIVIHTMENPEKPTQAEAVAAWFGSATAPMASAHVCVDSDSIVECVKPGDIAYAAPGANRDGYHIEHAGRANQTVEDWADSFSSAMLELSAQHAATIAREYGIPLVRLTSADVFAGAHGFCGHVDVTHAYKKSTHTDPGQMFPWGFYLERVKAYAEQQADTIPPPPTDPAPPDEVA